MSKKLLIVVDVQKDFIEGGALPYGYPTESNTKKVLEFVRDWCVNNPRLKPLGLRGEPSEPWLTRRLGKETEKRKC